MAKIFNGMAFGNILLTVASVASFLFPCPFCKVLAVQHLGEKHVCREKHPCQKNLPKEKVQVKFLKKLPACLREIRKFGEFLLRCFQEASQKMCIFFDGVGECPTEFDEG